MTTKLLPVSTIIRDYGLSRYMIYNTIKNDPSFPALNVGPKKNFRIDPNRFVEWLSRRTATATSSAIPTGSDLLKEMGYAKYQ
jgi:hypothetical protein